MWTIVVKFHRQSQRGTAVGGCGLEVDGACGRVGVWQVHHKTWASLVGRDARYVHQCGVCIMGVCVSDDWFLLVCSEHACECPSPGQGWCWCWCSVAVWIHVCKQLTSSVVQPCGVEGSGHIIVDVFTRESMLSTHARTHF